MSVFERVSVVRRTLDYRTGTEGPKHDPYSFDEWTVTKQVQHGPVWEYILHTGLGVTLQVYKDEELIQYWTDEEPTNLWLHFQNLTGIRVDHLEKVYQRLHGPHLFCDKCGSHELSWSEGFAGEQIQYCVKCNSILWVADPGPCII
jgi:hypothetical protein